MAKTLNKKLEYKIDASIADKLYKIKNQLKRSDHDWGKQKYVAGLCLLGEKDGIVDEFEPMLSKYGCWDSPKINHEQFYKAFEKMINKDRRVVGMAIIKPNNLGENIVYDIKENIFSWRKTFKDITQTIWIVVSDYNIITYRPFKDSEGSIDIRRSSAVIWDNIKNSVVMKMAEGKNTLKKIDNINEKNKMKDLIETVGNNIQDGATTKTIKKYSTLLNKKIKKHKKTKKEVVKKKEAKPKKEDMTPIGNGLFLLKTKEGGEILWQKT